ncbi:MAG TPA: hypothetical protein VFZ70_06090 [Euzebyales bacterium]
MRDDHQTSTDAVDDGELLAAYLDSETDDTTTARLERRLADDAALAERLDAIAQVRMRMQRLSEVSAPDEARQRLREELARVRGGTTVGGPAGADAPTGAGRRRWWALRAGPALAAAAVLVIAVFGAATLLRPVGGSEESGEALVADEGDAAEAAGAGGADDAPQADEQPAGEAADTAAAQAQAAPVDSDSEIATRALELRADAPDDLRARERQLRERAGLPTDRLCVTELDAATVDLVDEDGRVALAMLLSDVDQIVLLVPRTCAAIRTIPASR